MQRIENRFAELKNQGRKALITFITAGDPDLAATPRLVAALEGAGADIIELGVPFSDPLADGPTIQQASNRALRAGASLKKILGTVAEIRKTSEIPLVLMTYYNPVFRYGVAKLVADAAARGVDGLIVPDLPLEESGELRRLAAGRLAVIPLAAPTTGPERLLKIAAAGSGFLYYVSVTGITGTRTELPPELASSLAAVRGRVTGLPLAVGFGISTAEQARTVARHADAVIVGSALVKIVARHGAAPEGISALTAKVGELRRALDEAGDIN